MSEMSRQLFRRIKLKGQYIALGTFIALVIYANVLIRK